MTEKIAAVLLLIGLGGFAVPMLLVGPDAFKTFGDYVKASLYLFLFAVAFALVVGLPLALDWAITVLATPTEGAAR